MGIYQNHRKPVKMAQSRSQRRKQRMTSTNSHFLGSARTCSYHAVRSQDTLFGYFWITRNPRAMQEASHDPQACPDVVNIQGLATWNHCVMQWNLHDVLNQINLYSYQVRPCYDACNYHPNRIRQTLTHQVQVQQKIPKFGWFHFGSISLSLECYLRISHFFLDGNPLSFMLQFPRKLIFTGEPTKRKLHFPVQIAIFVAELPN